MDNKPVVNVVDYRADLLASCYLLSASCRICQERHVALLSRGQVPLPNDKGDRCPFCECAGTLFYGGLRDALTLLTGSAFRLLCDDPHQGFSAMPHCQIVLDTFQIFHAASSNPRTSARSGAKVFDNP